MSERPLAGRRIAVTRAADEAAELAGKLAALGADAIVAPAIRYRSATDSRSWESSLVHRRRWTHAIFTSPRAARYFVERLEAAGVPTSEMRDVEIAAIGARTARALEDLGLALAFTSERSTGVEFARELIERGVGPGALVLLPHSDVARLEVAEMLDAAGVTVLRARVYETATADSAEFRPLAEILDAGIKLDAVTFASPSAVAGYRELSGPRWLESIAPPTRVVSIGPTTSSALRDFGARCDGEAAAPGVAGLVAAVVECLAEE